MISLICSSMLYRSCARIRTRYIWCMCNWMASCFRHKYFNSSRSSLLVIGEYFWCVCLETSHKGRMALLSEVSFCSLQTNGVYTTFAEVFLCLLSLIMSQVAFRYLKSLRLAISIAFVLPYIVRMWPQKPSTSFAGHIALLKPFRALFCPKNGLKQEKNARNWKKTGEMFGEKEIMPNFAAV